jgi:hypothetical protein
MTVQQQNNLQQRILQQRTMLTNMLLDPMRRAANRCVTVWNDKSLLDAALMHTIRQIPYSTYLYAMNLDGRQISANASHDGLVEADFGRDRADRPYMQELSSKRKLTLSNAYISLRANRPSLTAVRHVYLDNKHIGYLGADFDLRDLPITKEFYSEPGRWRQIKGDPAIRGGVFQQRRIPSCLDASLDHVLPVLEELVTQHGAFHVKIHFSSSRATMWFVQDPYRYQILEFDELVSPDICLVYPHHPYPEDALVPRENILPILETFCQLRLADDTLYLRAGSVNIFNGIVGLNFSCDGSHYIPHDQFLAKDSSFWEGNG